MTVKAPTMLLEANFDIHQIGETLKWRFSRTDHNGCPIYGLYAGGIYYTVGEEMKIHLTAGSAQRLKSFRVLDCTLITRPALIEIGHGKPFKYAQPSPFIENSGIKIAGASVNLPGHQFKPSDIDPIEPIEPIESDYHRLAVQWEKHLTVGQTPGRWEFSFVVTVEVECHGAAPVQRVFCFDPEGEVGSTVSPPK